MCAHYVGGGSEGKQGPADLPMGFQLFLINTGHHGGKPVCTPGCLLHEGESHTPPAGSSNTGKMCIKCGGAHESLSTGKQAYRVNSLPLHLRALHLEGQQTGTPTCS